MNLKNRIIPVAIVAALLGGTVGAFVSNRHSNSEDLASTISTTPSTGLFADQTARQVSNDSRVAEQIAANPGNAADQASYRSGFMDGFNARDGKVPSATTTVAEQTTVPASRVAPVRTRTVRSYSPSRQVYYDYSNQPRQRTFWQKHRDKLTVAMGAGGGALLGSLFGGKKGATIGALAGGGGSALYTYKIRKRNRNY